MFTDAKARENAVREIREVVQIRRDYATTGGWTERERQLSRKYEGLDIMHVMLQAYDHLSSERQQLLEQLVKKEDAK